MDPRNPERITIVNPNVDIDDFLADDEFVEMDDDLDDDDFPDFDDDDNDDFDVGGPDDIPDEGEFIR